MSILRAAALATSLCAFAAQADRMGMQRVNTNSSNPSVAAAPANAHLDYYGGHVISSVHVIPVFWGSNVPSDVQGTMPAFYAAVTDSNYFDWQSEYDTSISVNRPLCRAKCPIMSLSKINPKPPRIVRVFGRSVAKAKRTFAAIIPNRTACSLRPMTPTSRANPSTAPRG